MQRGPTRRPAVLIIDEAQGLRCEVLEELRFLLNLEMRGEKLLQIVLAGQPELESKLRKAGLRQVQECVSVRYRTSALTLAETHDYVRQRLSIAGAAGMLVFEKEAVNAVFFYSLGVPRVINLLCERALVTSSSRGITPVPVGVIEEVASEFQFDLLPTRDFSTYSKVSSYPDWMTTPFRLASASLQNQAAEPSPANQRLSSVGPVSAAPSDPNPAAVK